MARTTLTKTTLLGLYPVLPLTADTADLNLQACSGSSGSNGNQFLWGNSKYLILTVQNSHGANAYTFTVTSAAVQPYNRTGDISGYSLAAGEIAQLVLPRDGFLQSDGMLYLEGNNAAVKFAAAGFDG